MSNVMISAPVKIPVPVARGGRKSPGPLARKLSALEVGYALEVSGVSASNIGSIASRVGKTEGKKFTTRKLDKVVNGEPVFGVWRVQ